MDIEKAIRILGEAAIVCFTIDDDFKEACRMGQQALVKQKERMKHWSLLTQKIAQAGNLFILEGDDKGG